MHGKGPRLRRAQVQGCEANEKLRFEVKPIPKHRIKNLFGALAEGV